MLAVIVRLRSAQKVVGPESETDAFGSGTDVTVTLSDTEQEFPSVMVTEYILVELDETAIEDVVCPVFQLYSAPPVAVRVTVSPEHTILSLLMVVTGSEFTEI